MRYLLSAFLITLLIAACSDNPAGPEFEPYRIGTWLVTTPSTADWEGMERKGLTTMSADTTVLTSPGQKSLTLKQDTSNFQNGFTLTFRDSTITIADSIDISAQTRFFFTKEVDALTLGGGAGFIAITPDFFEASVDARYYCNENTPTNIDAGVRVVKKDSTVFRTYVIEIDGFVPVLNDIICS